MERLKQQLKMLFATRKGWLSWIIANIIVAIPWIIPLIMGFILSDTKYYLLSVSIATFMALPFPPFWMLVVIIAVFLRNKIFVG
jgi:hypothetical protein